MSENERQYLEESINLAWKDHDLLVQEGDELGATVLVRAIERLEAKLRAIEETKDANG